MPASPQGGGARRRPAHGGGGRLGGPVPAPEPAPRAYVATRAGQVHLRDSGGRGPALLLLHMTPRSGRMWEPAIPVLAQADWRVLAPDLIGYGRSDPRPEAWRVADWADSLADLLDALGVAQATVLGLHVGAAVALELGLARPAQVRALVLDGLPFLSPGLRAAFAAMAAAPPPDSPEAACARAATLMRDYVPGWELRADTLGDFWPVLIDYLETGFVSSAPVMAAHDVAARLPLWHGPLLLTAAETESMAWTLDEARALAPHAACHRWAGTHPLHDRARIAEWAAPLLAFLGELP
jgi:pimeloyl-ACP methyl ester carboxylesterase